MHVPLETKQGWLNLLLLKVLRKFQVDFLYQLLEPRNAPLEELLALFRILLIVLLDEILLHLGHENRITVESVTLSLPRK